MGAHLSPRALFGFSIILIYALWCSYHGGSEQLAPYASKAVHNFECLQQISTCPPASERDSAHFTKPFCILFVPYFCRHLGNQLLYVYQTVNVLQVQRLVLCAIPGVGLRCWDTVGRVFLVPFTMFSIFILRQLVNKSKVLIGIN